MCLLLQEGGCSAPLGAHAFVEDNNLKMEAGVWSLNGEKSVRCSLTTSLDTKGQDDLQVRVSQKEWGQVEKYTFHYRRVPIDLIGNSTC